MLIDDVHAYLALRRGLGYELVDVGYMLESFARFSSTRRGCSAFVRAAAAIEWAASASAPAQRERRIRVVARFAAHARSEDRRHEVPPVGAFGRHRPARRRPHIYSDGEVQSLLAAAGRLGPSGSVSPPTYVALFGLLAATGLRVSEALALEVEDVAVDGLRILKTKFNKSRMVPVHKTTRAALGGYLEHRRALRPPTKRLFVTLAGIALTYPIVSKTFSVLRQEVIHPAENQPLPRIHDLRHTFAVRALENAPRDPRLLDRHMRALSTYMGHRSFLSTYWYLHATPLLMRRIADACETFIDGEKS